MSDSYLIDDSYDPGSIDPSVHGRGLVPRDYASRPFGSMFGAYSGKVKTKQECLEIAAERKAKGQTNRDVAELFSLPIFDQNGTNFCWMNAVAKILMYLQAKSGQKIIKPSAASGAAIIKGWRNQGGFGGEAVNFIRDRGLVPEFDPDDPSKIYWGNNDWRNRTLDNSENEARRVQLKGVEVVEVEQGDIDTMRSMLIDGWLIAAGLSWWTHEILITDYWPEDTYPFDNSWTDAWGDNGRGVLTPKKAVGDYVGFRTIVAA